MLNREFALWVLAAFVVSIPVMIISMKIWLKTFAYKTTLDWWIFTSAGIIAMLIPILTVTWQSYKAAIKNPVEALCYELGIGVRD
jgi:putative ABC transport system permease protein